MDKKITEVLEVFKSSYPKLKPIGVYSVPKGYLVIAPKVKEDYNDPWYFVDSGLSKATPFDFRRFNDAMKAIAKGPLWGHNK